MFSWLMARIRPHTDAEAANAAIPDTEAPRRWDDPDYLTYAELDEIWRKAQHESEARGDE